MGQQVAMGAMLQCSFGAAPSTLVVPPASKVLADGPPAANIMDHKPIANIPPFGTCSAPSNPAVIAALGAPVPCMPVTVAPWAPGSPTVLIGNMPALNNASKCLCTWGGVIGVVKAGTMKVTVP
jgi:Domain of unknown function (DUF4280)